VPIRKDKEGQNVANFFASDSPFKVMGSCTTNIKKSLNILGLLYLLGEKKSLYIYFVKFAHWTSVFIALKVSVLYCRKTRIFATILGR
jgi:hypothetical protein